MNGITFFALMFIITVCGLSAIKHWFNGKYPMQYAQCPTCGQELSSRDPIELNRAMGEHRTEHARQHAGRN